ncbi:Zinc Finger Cchc Domain-Containing Protein 18 [Manis pentadactyla]|nr:Zinc Finger Cchc Domain-Containing Protein 18 [Manis pentadactyla]
MGSMDSPNSVGNQELCEIDSSSIQSEGSAACAEALQKQYSKRPDVQTQGLKVKVESGELQQEELRQVSAEVVSELAWKDMEYFKRVLRWNIDFSDEEEEEWEEGESMASFLLGAFQLDCDIPFPPLL